MKKLLLSFALIGLSFTNIAQTAIDFVGSGHVFVPNANTALNGDPSWTIEFWLQDPDNNCFPLSSGGNYVRIFPNGVILFNGFMQSNPGAWPTDGQPHHIAFRSSASASAQIFVDGLPVSMAFGGPIGFGTGSVTLGSQFSSTTEVIDDFRVWDLTRSNAEILANYNQCLTGSESGLQIFYDFETGSGTTNVTNQGIAGGINNGSLNGMNPFTSWITGIDGCFTNPHALDFEKSSPDQYVDCGTAINSIFQGGEEVTVEAWVKVESIAGLPTILGNYDSGSMQYLLRIDGGLPTFWVGTPGFTSCSATTSISTGVWTHISGTYDGTNIRIYVNGVLENTVAKTGVFAANSNSLKIGNSAITGSEEFDGVIDDVRIWNCVKSDAAILADMNALYTGSESLVAYYDFSDGSGTTLTDLSGNGYHGTLQTGGNLPTWIAGQTLSGAPSFTGCPCVILEQTITEVDFSSCTSTSATVNLDDSENGLQYYLRNDLDNSLIDGPITGTGSGISFAAGTVSATTTFNVLAQVSSAPTSGLEFDGTNEHAVGPDAGLPLGNDARTIQGWIKTVGAIDGPEYIIEYGNTVTAGNECALGLHGTGVATLWRHSGDILGTTLIDDGNWHHLAYTHDGTTGKLYVDGALEGSITVPLNTAATGNYQLGSGSSDYLGGAIDNVSIWDYAKTESEIQDEMLTCFEGNEVGLVAYWDLNDGTGSGVATDKTGNGYDATLTNMDPSSDWITAIACVECELEMADQLTITIGDTESPVPDAATLSDVTAECSVTSLSAPTATDNCAGALTGTHNATLPITAQGTTTVTWTYDDGNGNTSTQTQDVVIDDVTVPVADVTTLSDVTAECTVTSLTAPTATDNCAGALIGTHNATLPITTQGTTTVTWTYDDGNGNTVTQTQDVVIDDVTVPVADVTTLSDVTAECSVTSLTAPTATDNCAGALTGTHNATLPITAQGTTTVTWTYDDGNGNTSTQTQDVVIDDVTDPVFSGCPTNITQVTDAAGCTSIVSWIAPTATDNCTASPVITTSHAPGSSFGLGTTTVAYTATDDAGNTETCSFDVTVTNDLTVTNGFPTNVTCNGSTDGQAFVNVSGGTTAYTFDWDNDGTGDNDDVEDLSGIGAGTYNLIVTDANGCTASTSATISEPTAVVIDAIVGTDPSACGVSDGSIALSVSGGAGLYSFDWDNDGTGDFDDDEDLSGIGSGTYSVIVQDDNGCMTSSSINLSDPSGPVVTITSTTDNLCFGDANGSIDATITGGLSPLTIDWDNDGTGDNDDTEDISGLEANTYNLVVTDANGCVGSASATIVDPAEVYVVETAVICSNDSLFLAGAYQTTAGIYMDTLSTVVNGCDSIIETTLSINLAYEITLTPITLCDGDSVMVFGTYYSVAGMYYDSLMTVNACDSITIQEVILNVVDATVAVNGSELTSNASGTGVTYQWIDCATNSVIVGETSQVYTASSNGDYAVIVDDNGCVDTSACENVSGIGFDELGLTFNVYPNPTQGEFVVQFDQDLNGAIIEIYSMSGQLISSQIVNGNKVEINMHDAERGTYLIKVQSERVVVVERLVKH